MTYSFTGLDTEEFVTLHEGMRLEPLEYTRLSAGIFGLCLDLLAAQGLDRKQALKRIAQQSHGTQATHERFRNSLPLKGEAPAGRDQPLPDNKIDTIRFTVQDGHRISIETTLAGSPPGQEEMARAVQDCRLRICAHNLRQLNTMGYTPMEVGQLLKQEVYGLADMAQP